MCKLLEINRDKVCELDFVNGQKTIFNEENFMTFYDKKWAEGLKEYDLIG